MPARSILLILFSALAFGLFRHFKSEDEVLRQRYGSSLRGVAARRRLACRRLGAACHRLVDAWSGVPTRPADAYASLKIVVVVLLWIELSFVTAHEPAVLARVVTNHFPRRIISHLDASGRVHAAATTRSSHSFGGASTQPALVDRPGPRGGGARRDLARDP